MSEVINLKLIQILNKCGASTPEALEAIKRAKNGEDVKIGDCDLHITKDGKIIALHESWMRIYIGDYKAHIIFQKNISFSLGFAYTGRKHRELSDVLDICKRNSPDGEILCECPAHDYNRRIKALNKYGFTVKKSNIDHCDDEYRTCYFVITA